MAEVARGSDKPELCIVLVLHLILQREGPHSSSPNSPFPKSLFPDSAFSQFAVGSVAFVSLYHIAE